MHMNIKQIMEDLKNHAREEIRTHKEFFDEATEDVKGLAQKHLDQMMVIHKAFWKKLKKAMRKK